MGTSEALQSPAGPPGSRRVARGLFRRACSAAGAATGLGLVLGFVHPPSTPLFLASLGVKAVFMFGLPRVPAAQPRALFGGQIAGALVGILCLRLFGDALRVYVLAFARTLLLMLPTKTVHPPAGATPLIMIHAHAGPLAIWQPVAAGLVVLALVAAAWSRLVPGMVHYPLNWLEKSPSSLSWGGWVD